MQKILIPRKFRRKFRIGQLVKTRSGTVARVIGSALYGIVDGKPTILTWVEYRLQSKGSKRTFYRGEKELEKAIEDSKIEDRYKFENVFLTLPFEVTEETRITQKVFTDYDELDALAKAHGYSDKGNSSEYCGWIASMGDSTHNTISMLREAMQKFTDVQLRHGDAVMGFCQTGNFSIGYTIYTKEK